MNRILLIPILLVLTLKAASAQVDWKLKTEKEGVKIYTSEVADSKVKQIKVEGEFKWLL
jgi:hypothetical protein